MTQADIGLIGLAVMGENLVMNMESKGFSVAVYNRGAEKTRAFLASRASGKNITGAYSLPELCQSLSRPRRVMLMVKAGDPVDALIEGLLPCLEPGDVIIDGGNSHYADTARRAVLVESRGLLYVGTGVSGGEEGALLGPSIMPGGSAAAWPLISPVFRAICAKAPDGSPCCDWVGGGGAGHFVKMVHNGIEYGDMQLICEAYHILRELAGLTPKEISAVFAQWAKGELSGYLVEITADILAAEDADGSPLVDKILDAAGQKGTGKWACVAALHEGVPLTLISEAVYARCLSALCDERRAASTLLRRPADAYRGEKAELAEDVRQALYASKIVSYAQGFALLSAASAAEGWGLDLGAIALLWRGGCIIRSAFLSDIKEAYSASPAPQNLMLAPRFTDILLSHTPAWRRVCSAAALCGIPAPAFMSALAYFDGYGSARLPASLLQAQRDYFGAHGFERTDAPRGEFFHHNWTGRGGDTAASTYTV
ncbi:MAG: decarboxylating NADP(+)-dependent phosphogluconate dehydrogenase [Oscillospiraceae bacterium]|jgi:6-phosphogluconate dehydrogenase|nr:decarboxylating NADP(+)-dependent phosphogluconate dehydrogenase [Oscillospiraceae bacterium]